MGHKVHPNGFRLGVSRTWNAKWYSDKDYTDLLKEDLAIRQLVEKRLANASVSLVEIERGINHVTVTVHTAKPGIVIGKGGANVESLRQAVGRVTTRKTRLVTQAIVGKKVDDAAAILRFMPQGAAKDVAKVLKSATANAENNHDLSADDLVVVAAIADEGPTIKRFRPRAQGRAFPIHKPMTHVTIVVESKEA
jgi:ribosomal protein L22